MKPEAVLSVPHGALLSQIRSRRGFIPFSDDVQPDSLLDPVNLWFVPRPHAEEDDAFKQVIPYLVVTCGQKVLLYRRTPKGGETRLHLRYSIGAGGHINVADSAEDGEILNYVTSIASATTRELLEELAIITSDVEDVCPIGLIYDDRDAVGRVHLGYVQVVKVKSQTVRLVEDHLENVSFTDVDELQDYYEQMESWSQFVTDYIRINKDILT